MNCTNCQKQTNNPKFCSQTCSAIVNNKLKPKRKLKPRLCTRCKQKLVLDWRATRCVDCKNIDFTSGSKTIGYYRTKLSVKYMHPSWLHAHVRSLARTKFKDLRKLPCKNCGYGKHVELAHRKPLSSFEDEEIIDNVNAENNVVQLCRNCHWEFDHGMLMI